jgi:CRISPR-associated endonuclease Csn1
MRTIWSFDLGKGSIGEAVRDLRDHSFPHKESLLIPEDFAETQSAATRRRMKRTRESHKARERWLEGVWRAAGLTPLIGRRVERVDGKWRPVTESKKQKELRALLEREFPKKGDTTCHNSALLRIKLLRGEKLAEWQIYKALHSAIQKRGYGRVPWASKVETRSGKTEEEIEKEQQKRDPGYAAAAGAWGKYKQEVADPSYHFPCYYDALKMGLWNHAQPSTLRERIDCHAASTRRVRFDRVDVENEIHRLANNAVKQLPSLCDAFQRWKTEGCTVSWEPSPPDCKIAFGKLEPSAKGKHFPVHAADFGSFLVHGPAGELPVANQTDFAAYLDYRSKCGIHPGSTDDWMGATAQKTPRFDNRIINDCALLDEMQVCNVTVRFDKKNARPYPESLLASEVTFLMKLKNTLVANVKGQRKLTAKEIRTIFELISAKVALKDGALKDYSASVIKSYSLTQSDWSRKGIKELGLSPIPGHEVIKAPKTEGRSRFSRPALRLIRELILSGEKPSSFKEKLLKRDTHLQELIGLDLLDDAPAPQGKAIDSKTPRRPWILKKHLKFLDDLIRTGDTWAAIHIPEQRMDALEARHTQDGIVDKDAAIRELIGEIKDPVVRHRLGLFAKRLQQLHSKFGMPEEIVLEFVRTDFMGDKAKAALASFQKKREQARAIAVEQAGKSDALKYELAVAQAFQCLYCAKPLLATYLGSYQIDHIVPSKKGGPDAMVNYVIAHQECNHDKGNRTPHEWLSSTPGWDAYCKRVESRATELRNKKVQLLLREDAIELVDRYKALAETAWISKLSQKIIGLYFGWRNGIDQEGVKRVAIISGGLTARVRRKYRLNSILSPCPAGEDAVLWEASADKNRSDDRHHALDAMVINFLPQWARHAQKEHFFRFPEPVQKNAKAFFEQQIREVMPRNIAFEKVSLAETIYGSRGTGDDAVIVQRVPMLELAMKSVGPNKKAFDGTYLLKQLKSVREPLVVERIGEWLDDSKTESDWKDFCENMRLPRRDGSPGPRVIRVNVSVGSLSEYAEMSKDKTGSFRKGKKGHRGQVVYKVKTATRSGDPVESTEVRPVYVHESHAEVEAKLRDKHGSNILLYGFFQSGCHIVTTKETSHVRAPLPPGVYLLNTIRSDGNVQITTRNGKTYPDVPFYSLKNLVAARLYRSN